MQGSFRKNFAVGILIAAVIVAALLVTSYFAAPSAPQVVVNGKDGASGFVRLDETLVRLELIQPDGAENLRAAIHLFGVETQSSEFREKRIEFSPFLVPAGQSTILIELRRSFGPFSVSDWMPLHVFARAGKDDKPVLSAPDVVWSSRVEVTGTAVPGSSVTFLVNDKPYADPRDTTGTPVVGHARADGRFDHVLELAEPGRHRLKAVVKVGGSGGSQAVSEERIVVFEDALPALIERKLTINVSERGLSWTTIAKFQPGDPRLKIDFSEGQSSKAFLKSIHGDVTINGSHFGSARSGTLGVETHRDQVWISASVYNIPPQVLDAGRLEISRRVRGNLAIEQDLIEIRSDGLQLTGFTPRPKEMSGQSALWTMAGSSDGSVSVAIIPPERRRSVQELGPGDLLPPILTGLYGALIALTPVFGLLQLQATGFPGNALTYSGLRQDGIILCVLGIYAPMQYLVRNLQYDLSRMVVEQFVDARVTALLLAGVAAVLVILFAAKALAAATCLCVRNPTVCRSAEDIEEVIFLGVITGIPVHMAFLLNSLPPNEFYPDFFLENAGALAITWLAAATLLLCLFRTGCQKTLAILQRGGLGALFWGLVTAGVLIAAYPADFVFDPLTDHIQSPFYDAVYTLLGLIGRLGTMAPLLAVTVLCLVLYAIGDLPSAYAKPSNVARLLFAGFLVGTGSIWLLFPVPLLFAFFLFEPLLWPEGRRATLIRENRDIILQDRTDVLDKAYANASNSVRNAGWFGLGLFGVSEEEKKKTRDHKPLKVKLPEGDDSEMAAADVAFALGPASTAAENAKMCLKVGLWGAAVFVAIYALPTFVEVRQGDDFPGVYAVVRVLSVGGYWLIGAFFLGYFYEWLRGSCGWKKGAWLAFGISLAIEPMALISASSAVDYSVIAVSVVQRFVYFVLVGLIALDLNVFKMANGGKVEWRVFPLLSGLSIVQAVASIVIAGIGVTISSVFSGQLTTVLAQVAAALIPVIDTAQSGVQ